MISKSDDFCFIYEISEGMGYVHFLKIVHRNLRPSNIFINSDLTIKISDFVITQMMFPKDQLSLIDANDTKLFFFKFNNIPNLRNILKMNVYDYIQCKVFEIPKHSLNSLEN